MTRCCVLMYHGLAERAVPSADLGTHDPLYVVGPGSFEAQMELLRADGYVGLSLGDFLRGRAGDRMTAVITFDDGNRTDYLAALPILQKLGFTATFYITTGWIGRAGFLTEPDIRALAAAGMEIGSHGHTHRYFSDMGSGELEEELARSLSVLANVLGRRVTALSAPGGRLHPKLRSLASAAGVTSIATSRFAAFDPAGDPFSVPRVPIQSTTTLDAFRSMYRCERGYFLQNALRHGVLAAAKRALGNRRYERLRSRLIRQSDV